ncbi:MULTISPECIES: hypothetical protein [Sphingobium]|uniref:Uncharacterized protein n=1 Tax=Sphingobium lignivorans TaxID=2735886 RepID=A0ABR6NNP7_9SPHN|nr:MULTISPECIES: hypothetical protein [Sphingobium]MBB5987819.1 hypothetical protein [Sphingobium lignivorans]BAK68451.1 hypothetical protein SLG_37760 [Sphingobium sp. SYK-6]
MDSFWLLITVAGPILLALTLAYAIWRNRRETGPGDVAHSDRAAKRLRDQLDQEDKRRDHRTTTEA